MGAARASVLASLELDEVHVHRASLRLNLGLLLLLAKAGLVEAARRRERHDTRELARVEPRAVRATHIDDDARHFAEVHTVHRRVTERTRHVRHGIQSGLRRTSEERARNLRPTQEIDERVTRNEDAAAPRTLVQPPVITTLRTFERGRASRTWCVDRVEERLELERISATRTRERTRHVE